ncbi:MAG: ABC transporter, permease protein 2 (cluster 1, maltose/g3p/polyamine/iron), partial [uncultured Rubrobacteraceae bacterium]
EEPFAEDERADAPDPLHLPRRRGAGDALPVLLDPHRGDAHGVPDLQKPAPPAAGHRVSRQPGDVVAVRPVSAGAPEQHLRLHGDDREHRLPLGARGVRVREVQVQGAQGHVRCRARDADAADGDHDSAPLHHHAAARVGGQLRGTHSPLPRHRLRRLPHAPADDGLPERPAGRRPHRRQRGVGGVLQGRPAEHEGRLRRTRHRHVHEPVGELSLAARGHKHAREVYVSPDAVEPGPPGRGGGVRPDNGGRRDRPDPARPHLLLFPEVHRLGRLRRLPEGV